MSGEDYGRDAVAAVVRRVVRAYPPGVADVEVEGEADDWMWEVRVLPRVRGAAAFTISLFTPSVDEVVLQFGETHSYVWDDNPTELLRGIERYCEAVAAGRFIEAGREGDSYARMWDEQGTEWGTGAMHLPWPWRWRRTRTYTPYGERG